MKPTSEEKEAEVQRLLDEIQRTLRELNARLDRLDRDRRGGYTGYKFV